MSVIELDAEEWERLLKLIDNPPPSPALIELMEPVATDGE